MKSEPSETVAGTKRNIVQAMQTVASRLGNTPTICRKCYVHPALIESYLSGAFKLPRARRQGLSNHEASVLAFLDGRRPRRRSASAARSK